MNPAVESDKAPAWLDVVRDQVESLRFGVVQIVVHESRATCIERTEKARLEDSPVGRRERADH